MDRTISGLEQQWTESEKKRLDAENKKQKKIKDLPILESETILKTLEKSATEENKETILALINFGKLVAESTTFYKNILYELQSHNNDFKRIVDSLEIASKSLRNVSFELLNLNRKLDAEMKQQSEVRKKEAETLGKLDKYLDNWL